MGIVIAGIKSKETFSFKALFSLLDLYLLLCFYRERLCLIMFNIQVICYFGL